MKDKFYFHHVLHCTLIVAFFTTIFISCSSGGDEKETPDKPVVPTDTIKPVDPTDTIKPTEPTDTIKPVDPTDTVKPIKPVDSTLLFSKTEGNLNPMPPGDPNDPAIPVVPGGEFPPITPHETHVFGYLIVPTDRVDDSYQAGYSMYVMVYPFSQTYNGPRYQTGLIGTWMHPDNPGTQNMYTDIEGGLGWWRGTEYPTPTPKFSMGGVQVNFKSWANGPGVGKGRNWNENSGKYGIAQLSPWLLWPPDNLNIKQGSCGELFGSGYLPLPLTEPKSTTAGKNITTGNQCWTLFLNTKNFKGPVAFFLPYYWSEPYLDDPAYIGKGLDQRPVQANKAFQQETQYIYSYEATDHKGDTYARMAPTQYPINDRGETEMMHKLMVYKKGALWDRVEAWFKGGPAVTDPSFDLGYAEQQYFKGNAWSTWKFENKLPKELHADMNIIDQMDFSKTEPHGATLRFKCEGDLFTKDYSESGKPVVILPEYYKLVYKDASDKKGKWMAISPDSVPAETNLQKMKFGYKHHNTMPFTTPYVMDDPNSCWKKPGPVAGPFKAKLGDGSTVTYCWYRFCDQPALLNADMTVEEREEMQRRVELLHKNWTKDKNYLPDPTPGFELTEIDPALIVTPPAGFEYGYVPIAVSQGLY